MRLRQAALLAGLGATIAGGTAAVAMAGDGFGPAAFRSHGGRHGVEYLCGERRERRMQDMVATVEGFATFTPEQQAAWDALKSRLDAGSQRLDAACESLPPVEGRPAPDQRLARMETMLEAGLAAVREVRPAFAGFYATLDEKQKTAFDRLLQRGHRHRRG